MFAIDISFSFAALVRICMSGLNVCLEYCKAWNLKFNVSKSNLGLYGCRTG